MARIALAVPSGDTWKAGFGLDWGSTMAHFMRRYAGKHSLLPTNLQVSMLPKGRADLVKQAMKQNATHILWTDADARFPPDTLERLFCHDLDFVACNAVRRTFPCTPTSRTAEGKIFYTHPGSFGLEEVTGHVGLHTALTKIEVFERTPKPWFCIPYVMESDDYQGEDVWFCNRYREHGGRIFIDHDLSWQNRHSGGFEFSHQVAEAQIGEHEKEVEAKRAKDMADMLEAAD